MRWCLGRHVGRAARVAVAVRSRVGVKNGRFLQEGVPVRVGGLVTDGHDGSHSLVAPRVVFLGVEPLPEKHSEKELHAGIQILARLVRESRDGYDRTVSASWGM